MRANRFEGKTGKIIKLLCSAILALYPLTNVHQGLSVIDTTYSPANFVFHGHMSGTWIVATYLANALGHFFTTLPGGDHLVGLNVYTSLLISVCAVLSFWVLSRDMGVLGPFAGGMIAIGLCWCPSTILYNYLTYLLFTAGALMIYLALKEADEVRTLRLLAGAGVLLGLNVITRLPNVTECILILAVWFAGFINKTPAARVIKQTFACIMGYVCGFLAGFIPVCVRFGAEAYADMIRSLFMMTDKATDYKPASMITGMLGDYAYAFRWICIWIAATAACFCAFMIIGRFLPRIKGTERDEGIQAKPFTVIRIICIALIYGLAIRLCFGQGMFSFRYYEYGSMYFWAVILLFYVTFICIALIAGAGKDIFPIHIRTLALIVLLVMYVTCIGSNNGLYPMVNNMFITAPFAIYVTGYMLNGLRPWMGKMISDGKHTICASLGITGFVLIACLLIQSVGFHIDFAFGDGIYGESRSARIDDYIDETDLSAGDYKRVSGIYTTEHNAENLYGLMEYVYGTVKETSSKKLITYGDLPGLGYILDMPGALTTFWPDLDSFNMYEWDRDMEALRSDMDKGTDAGRPLVIVSLPVAAWLGQDREAFEYFDIDAERYASDAKLGDLGDFLSHYGYKQGYANDEYVVYE